MLVDLFVPVGLGTLGLLVAGAGGVLTIRTYFCDVARRERNAFELGLDAARGDKVQPLR